MTLDEQGNDDIAPVPGRNDQTLGRRLSRTPAIVVTGAIKAAYGEAS
jgi:hypothetical protein